jgi:hypothetical protein
LGQELTVSGSERADNAELYVSAACKLTPQRRRDELVLIAVSLRITQVSEHGDGEDVNGNISACNQVATFPMKVDESEQQVCTLQQCRFAGIVRSSQDIELTELNFECLESLEVPEPYPPKARWIGISIRRSRPDGVDNFDLERVTIEIEQDELVVIAFLNLLGHVPHSSHG